MAAPSWRRGVLGSAVAMLLSAPAHAQDTMGEPPLVLQPSWRLLERLPPDAQSLAPSFVSAQQMSSSGDGVTHLEGDAVLRRHDTVVRGDRLSYDENNERLTASGRVRIVRDGNVYEGPELELKLDDNTGFFLQPTFSLLRTKGKVEQYLK